MPDRRQTFFARLIALYFFGYTVFILSSGYPAPLVLQGRVLVDRLNVRETPSRESNVLTILPRNTIVEIHNHLSGWYEILLPNQQRGFISDRPEYVRMEDAAPEILPPSSPDTKPQVVANLNQQTRQIRSDLERRQAEIKTLSKEENSALHNLGRMERRISQSQEELETLTTESRSIDGRIQATTARQQELFQKTEHVERQAALRLKTLYKLSRLGTMHFLASTNTLSQLEYRKNMLGRVLSEDWKLLNELSEMKKELDQLSADLSVLQEENRTRQSLIQKKKEFLSSEKERQKTLLAEIRSKKNLEMQAISALQQASDELNSMLVKLTAEPQEQLPAATPPIGVEKSGSIVSRKGRLSPPVAGKTLSIPAAELQAGIHAAVGRLGLHFQTDRGEPVHAIHSGKIVFSEWVKGYGNMMIIDHGDHYFSVYAHLEDFFRIRGDIVQTDDIIGTAGETNSISGAGVYFEIRKKSEPVDLRQWLTTTSP